MCGIVGFITSKAYGASDSDAKAFWNMLLADTVRGGDGTGMYWANDDGKTWYYKDVGPAAEVLDRNTVAKFLNDARFAVGHNRAATLGAVNKDATHPFVTEHLVGVHNGTVSSWKSLGAKEATMDSMAIYECLNDVEHESGAVTEMLAKIDGAYSLVWYDKRIKSLRFARNSQRPMRMVLATNGDLWFGSELRMVEWCLDRNNIKMAKSWSLDTNCLVTVPVYEGEPSYRNYSPRHSYGGNYWNPGITYPMYGGYDDFEDAMYTPAKAYARSYTSQGALRPTGMGPRKISVTNLSGIERSLPINLSDKAEDQIAKSVRIMLGREQGDVLGRPLDEYLQQYLAEATPGATTMHDMVRVPVHVVKQRDNQLLGYLVAHGAKVPVVMTGAHTPETSEKIRSIIEDGHTARIPDVLVYGLELYHQADVAYRAGPPICGPDRIERGEPLAISADMTLNQFFGDGHPEITKDVGSCNWELWSTMTGGLI